MLKRHYSIRVLMIFVGFLCMFLAYMSPRIVSARREAISAQAIESSGGWVTDTDPYRESGPGEFLENLFGRHFFHPVVEVQLRNRTDLPHLSSFPNLKRLYMGARVEDEDLEILESLKQVELLDLSNSNISNEGLKRLASLSRLEHLDITNCEITDDAFKYLSVMNLKTFFISGTKISLECRDKLEAQSSVNIYPPKEGR